MENGASNGHTAASTTELWPTRYLEAVSTNAADRAGVALIVLNTPISGIILYKRLYDQASFVVCADGGANRVHSLVASQFPENDLQEALKSTKPDAIHGDLDSLNDDVRKQYEKIGVSISLDPDQYSTDFGKAIKKIIEKLPTARDVLVLGSIGGRVDQGIGLLGEMYREQKFNHPDLRFWLFSETSITMLLPPGTSKIHTPLKDGLITPNVGILPMYGKASITLKGFEWDVEDWPTELGGQLSTSNHVFAEHVFVTTDVDVLFTIERKVGR